MGELKKIDVRTIGFVDRAANRRRFLLVKSTKGGTPMPDTVQIDVPEDVADLLVTEQDDEQRILSSVLAKASEKDKRIAAMMLRMAAGLEDEGLKQRLHDALAGVAKAKDEDDKDNDEYGYGYPPPKRRKKTAKAADDEPEVVLPDDLAPLVKADPSRAQHLVTLVKRAQAGDDAAAANIAILKSIWAEADRAKQDAAAARQQLRRAEFLEKAAAIPAVAIGREEAAALLEALDDAGVKVGDKPAVDVVLPLLKSAGEALQRLAAIELGSGAVPQPGMQKITALARELRKQAGATMTEQQAIAKVLREHPELYAEIRAQERKGVS